jgi:3D-(3,5/4)-trihydroxycyclohexane-1,2-dione acylhydrolase (decyclizing)
MAKPDREVIVVVGDGSYLMMNSEIATTVMLNKKVIIVVLDNRGFGCINRLQRGTGGASFNNLLDEGTFTETTAPKVDFAAHAKALGAESESVSSLEALEAALGRARAASQSYVIAIDTDPYLTAEGGSWWEVGVPEVSERETVTQAYREQQIAKQKQPY